jgi:23S rRNA (uracil1939-C5)-methyltransferase
MQELLIEKLVHGGQAIGTLEDGKKVFVWNALPGERVRVRLTRNKRSHAEGIAEEILESSPDRTEPKDAAYLSTSPWQIMSYEAENRWKREILQEVMQREAVTLESAPPFVAPDEPYHYRNKMEYSFWGDEAGLHLALFRRGTHGKQIVEGSSIARPEVDEIANKICTILGSRGIRASSLKTVVVRCSRKGDTAAALFVREETFPRIKEFAGIGKGFEVYYSDPRSPASVLTKKLYGFGDVTLLDEVADVPVIYDVNSFFQVNVPVFESALAEIKAAVDRYPSKVDFYSGVGAIGLAVGADVLVETDPRSAAMARLNARSSGAEIIEAGAEQALEYITGDAALILDPPRAGLHRKVADRILEAAPPAIVYLSCNPATQARDLRLLGERFGLAWLKGYNFFPRTPHIESLALLVRK